MNKKKTAGRPKKLLTDDEIKEIETLSAGMTIEQIANYFEMSESTFNKLKAKDKNILTVYNRYKAKTVSRVVNRLFDVIEGNTNSTFPAIKFYLETQAGYSTKKDNDITIDAGGDGKFIVKFNHTAKPVDK